MVYVRIELWPRGDQSRKRTLGEAHIFNTGDGTLEVSNYGFKLSKFGGFGPKGGNVWRKGTVHGFPRKKLGPWDLLQRVIEAVRS